MKALTTDKSYICYYNADSQQYVINNDHQYYHQIQGQLHILNKKLCYLVIWTPNTVLILNVHKNDEWASNIEILQSFFHKQFIPHLLK